MAEIAVDVCVEAEGWLALAPDLEHFVKSTLQAAAAAEAVRGEVSVLFCDDAAMQDLNARFRGQNKPTNVLAFPAAGGAGGADAALGDIALALETVTREAQAQNKTARAHLAHLLTHGFLHLIGYDHVTEPAAERMEDRERAILATLGFSDPYAVDVEALPSPRT